MPISRFAFRAPVRLAQPNGGSHLYTVSRIFFRRQTDQKLVPVYGGEADNTAHMPPGLRDASVVYELTRETQDAQKFQTVLAEESNMSYA